MIFSIVAALAIFFIGVPLFVAFAVRHPVLAFVLALFVLVLWSL